MMNLDIKPQVLNFADLILITFIITEEDKRDRHRRSRK